jgi:hypothetical protein
MTISTGDRILRGLVDTTTRSGYAILGAKPRTPHESASEYYQFDWEYAQTPEQSSWLASSWVTYPLHTQPVAFAVPKSDDKKSYSEPDRLGFGLQPCCLSRVLYSRRIISPLMATKVAFLLRTS